MGTAQASAVAMLCASRRGIPVALHTPSEVKAAVTGSGRADKAQVGAMVTRLLRLDARRPSRPTPPTRWPWRSATSGAAPALNRLQAGRTRQHSVRKVTPMIAFVRGPVAALAPDTAVVEVGGVGHGAAVHARHAGRAAHRAEHAKLATAWSCARTR